MKAKELLRTSLDNLLILQDASLNLTIDEAMDLNGAIECLSDILKNLEKKSDETAILSH